MFTAEQTKKFKAQLYGIYDELRLNSKETEQEIWWPTPFYISLDEYEFRESYDLFNGNCGIVLFFLKLYQFDGDADHLRIVNKAMYRILNADAVLNPKSFALYTGLGGVIYTCLKVFEATGNGFYKKKALELTLKNQRQLTTDLLKTDLLSGYSGNLLMLTLLYNHTANVNVLKIVNFLIDRLITEARISEQGLKWDYSSSKKAYDSMTGFSHGASGIAWVLMQVGRYFNAAGLIYLAEEALKYEMQYFYTPAKNWLDLRLGPHRLNKPDVHEWNLQTFLPEMSDVNAWAHGAAGIGMSRQIALDLTKEKQYDEDCKNALERCLNDLEKLDRNDFTLVSGYCGMIPFLFNCETESQIVVILDKARKLHQKTRSFNTYVSCGVDDYGLLSGKAGIGYIILAILMGQSSDNILAPELPKNSKKSDLEDTYSEIQVKKSIFSKYYTRTLGKLKKNPVFEDKDINDFKIRLQSEISKIQSNEIVAAFNLENELVDLWKEHKGYFSFEQKQKHLLKKAEESLIFTDQYLIEQFFRLSRHVKLYLPNKLKESEILLLVSNKNGIEEVQVGVFATMILNAIGKKELKVGELLQSFIPIFFSGEPSAKSLFELKDKVMQQIRLLIKAGFIEIDS
nr:lanthionine synthetase LanC family protein [Pedobacter kyonggii]